MFVYKYLIFHIVFSTCIKKKSEKLERRRSEKERESERKKDRNHCMLPPGVLAGATARQDIVKLVITINRS